MPDLRPNETEALRALKERLSRDFRLVELRLFGSKARGDSHPESDVDVLIVLEQVDWETRRAVSALCSDLSIDYRVVLVPVLYSRERFDSPLVRTAPFLCNVAREGLVL
jgi:predicted nucleotidyltransferase